MHALNLLLEDSRLKDVDEIDSSRRTALFRASRHCNIAAVRRLIENKSNVNFLMGITAETRCLPDKYLLGF